MINLTGEWTGIFVYDPDVVEPSGFLASIQQTGPLLSVRTQETSPLFGPLLATMAGVFRDGCVHLKKTYDQDGFCDILYDGNVSSDGNSIRGAWRLASRALFDDPASGSFEMQRRPKEQVRESIEEERGDLLPVGVSFTPR